MTKAAKKFIRKKKPQKPSVPRKHVSPSNSRSIPEHRQNKKLALYTYIFAICFICGIILMGILLVEHAIDQAYKQLQIVQAQRHEAEYEVAVWKKIIQKYPDYRDGYLQLAINEYKVGDKEAAKTNTEKALVIDPNFTQARVFERTLE